MKLGARWGAYILTEFIKPARELNSRSLGMVNKLHCRTRCLIDRSSGQQTLCLTFPCPSETFHDIQTCKCFSPYAYNVRCRYPTYIWAETDQIARVKCTLGLLWAVAVCIFFRSFGPTTVFPLPAPGTNSHIQA
jgi:hypothetical protein